MSGSFPVYVIDDDQAVRRSISVLLSTRGMICADFSSAEAFLETASGLEPGCVLMDLLMPGMGGLEALQAMHARGIRFPVVVMTGHGDVSTAVKAMKAGALDFVEKPFDADTFVQAIGSAFDQMEANARHAENAAAARQRIDQLTPREHDVLIGLVRGFPNKTIAYDLGISPRTVEIHRANLMAKLGVSSLSEALRLAFLAGLDETALP